MKEQVGGFSITCADAPRSGALGSGPWTLGPELRAPGSGPGLTCVVAQRDTQGRVQQGASLSVTLRRRGSDPSTGEDTSRQKDMLSWLPAGRRTRTLTPASVFILSKDERSVSYGRLPPAFSLPGRAKFHSGTSCSCLGRRDIQSEFGPSRSRVPSSMFLSVAPSSAPLFPCLTLERLLAEFSIC